MNTRSRISIENRFKDKYKIDASTGCWEWTGAKTRGGYGNFRVFHEGRWTMRRAHRVSYELYKGAIVEPIVRHTCDNTGCVNPEHLVLGNCQDNTDDRMSRNRHVVSKPLAKITQEDANKIRELKKTTSLTDKEIGSLFGLKQNSVNLIVNNKRWR